MQFIDFLKANQLSVKSVAEEWGISPSTLTRPTNGTRWPSELVMVKAFELSGGKVSLPDWIETCRALLEQQGILAPKESNDGKNT